MALENLHTQESGGQKISRRGALKAGGLLIAGGVLAEGGRQILNQFNGPGMHTIEDAQRHLRESRKDWIPANQIKKEGCPDGRTDQTIVGTFGGDIGDFNMKVSALQDASGQRFTKPHVHEMFDNNLKSSEGKKILLHTDDHAMEHLAHDLHVSVEEIYAIIRDPNGHRGRMMELLKDPKNMGCGHAARLKGHTQDYPGMTPEIIDSSIESFFDETWNGNPNMDYAVLHNGHREKSVLRVSSDSPLNGQTPVLMIQPSFMNSNNELTSAYVIHPQFEQYTEGQWIEHTLEISGLMNINLQRFRTLMREYRQSHLQRTARDLVTTQPTYDVKYDPVRLSYQVQDPDA